MKKVKKIVLLMIVLFAFTQASANDTSDTLFLSLTDAVNLALKQNQQLKGARMDEEANKYKIREIKSGALPQITGEGSFNDNFSRASQILPGEIFGQPGSSVAVKFGTRYQMGASVQVNQKLVDPTLFAGMKAAKAGQGYYQLLTFKNKEDLIYNVVNVYMQIEMNQKQEELIKGNLDRMDKLVEITSSQFREGIVKKLDVDQLKVNQTNLKTQYTTTLNNNNQLLNTLKILMNVDVYKTLAITNEIGAEKVSVTDQLFTEENTELNLLDYEIRLQELNTNSIRAGYLPSLSAIANYGWQGQTDEMFDSKSLQGFNSGLWGLKLSVPIFDGLTKRNRIMQSKITSSQMQLKKEYLTGKVNNDFVNAKNNLDQNKEVLQAQSENMQVAEELYGTTKLSYTEGISPLSELINAENALKEAQTQYLTALLQMNIAELDLMKTSGQLSKVIKGI